MKTTFGAVRAGGVQPGQWVTASTFKGSTCTFQPGRPAGRRWVWAAALCIFGSQLHGRAAPRGPDTVEPPRLTIRVDGPDLTLLYSPSPSPGVMTIFQTDRLTTPPSDWTPVHTTRVAAWQSGSVILSNHVGPSALFFRSQVSAVQIPEQMVWIAPGTFLMGSPASEPDRLTNEGPQHSVRITQGFWLAKYEVTQAEYLALMHANPSVYQGDPRCPVDSVSWEMATNYCAVFTERERLGGRVPPGYVYRLPTEAEWEYACRAGTITRYSFGNDVAQLYYYAWSGIGGADGHHHPVGSLKPNAWGLYDMHGNVFEYVLDWYAPYPGNDEIVAVPRHLIRGGSFYCPADVLRSACRSHTRGPGQPSNLAGFRVALGPDGPLKVLQRAFDPP